MFVSRARLLFLLLSLPAALSACVRSAQETPAETPVTLVHSLSNGQIAYLRQLDEQGTMPEPDQPIPLAIPEATLAAPTIAKTACEVFISQLPKDYFSGFVSVSEDPADPTSPNVQVFYYGRKVEGQTPVVFFNGGPAADSHNAYRNLTTIQKNPKNAAEWNKIPFVFIDQRGNGCSSPYPKGHTPEVLARLRHYGMRSIVHDAEAIRREVFGQKPWKVFGQSYGAAIVHRYVMLFPKSVEAAFAHANTINSDGFERVANRLLSQHRVLDVYLEKFPDDRARLEKLNEILTATRCFKNEATTEKVCGLRAISSLVKNLAFTYQWPTLHKWLVAIVKDGELNEKTFSQFLAIFAFSAPRPPPDVTAPATSSVGNNALWAEHVIDFYDRDVPALTRANCVKFIDLLKAKGEAPETWLLHECQAKMQFAESPNAPALEATLNKIKEVYGTDPLKIDAFVAARKAHPEIPFHLYSGELDPYVPVENFQEELKAAGELLVYVNFPDTGHDGFSSEGKVWADLIAPERR